MSKVALITTVGPTDVGIQVDDSKYGKTRTICFLKNGNRNDVSVHAFLTDLKKLKLEPSELAMDLLIVSASMYAADTRFLRSEFGEDGWTRQIDMFIPVSDANLWTQQKKVIERIFKFLTGDIWNLNFRNRSSNELVLSPRGKLAKYGMPYQTNSVCLFSGGMDSLIGAIDLIANGVKPLLLSHSKSADVSSYQVKCHDALNSAFPDIAIKRVDAHVSIPKAYRKEPVENTERGRSFLFLSLGAICASSLANTSRLYVPENGLISLNIPLTPLRVGSHSTRTTHPYYFDLMKLLFDALGLGVEIINPYQFKTKGEMLMECNKPDIIAKTVSMSCSHPSARWLGMGNIHCGYCVPCINRQAAFLRTGLVDSNDYREDIYDTRGLKITQAEGADLLAFKYMIEKNKRSPNYVLAAIRNTGPLGENVDSFVDVYKRGLDEIEALIKKVRLV